MRAGRRSLRAALRGFTLIELMITVAVLAIVAGVAYPSYRSQVAKSRRADARSALVAAAQGLERYYTERATYLGAALGVFAASSSANGFYTLSFTAQTATAFTLQATPAGAQAGDACGSLTYDQSGTKGVSGTALAPSACW